MEAKSRRFQYWKRIQAGILFFVFLFGALFMGSAQHAFATERVGREEVTRVGGRGMVLCQEIVQDKKRKFYYPARTSFSLDWLVRYNFSNSLGDKYPQ